MKTFFKSSARRQPPLAAPRLARGECTGSPPITPTPAPTRPDITLGLNPRPAETIPRI